MIGAEVCMERARVLVCWQGTQASRQAQEAEQSYQLQHAERVQQQLTGADSSSHEERRRHR